MLTLEIASFADAVAGTLAGGPTDGVVTGVVTDSRDARPGVAFFALTGERTDGHEHIRDAVARGARVVVARRDEPQVRMDALDERYGATLVIVDDVLAALQRLAAYHRSRLDGVVVGITGSTGKTTTKDFVRAVLSTALRTEATTGNRNNELGVPLTLLGARPDVEALVVEMGMRGAGQIRELCEIARPSIAAITNIGLTHVEVLGSEQAIADAKAELIECVAPEGEVFLNADDEWSRKVAERSAAHVTWFGLGADAEVTARDIVIEPSGAPSFTLVAPGVERRVALAVLGKHNVYNALCAAAIGLYLGISADRVAEGLANATMTGMRMEVIETAAGVVVLNDAYNANPTSMRAALHTLAEMSAEGRRIAVLGDMAELGSLTDLAHFRLGEEVAALGLDALVSVGSRARRIAEGALAERMPAETVRPCETAEEAGEVLDDLLACGDVVLVKASRCMGLESVVEGIVTPHA